MVELKRRIICKCFIKYGLWIAAVVKQPPFLSAVAFNAINVQPTCSDLIMQKIFIIIMIRKHHCLVFNPYNLPIR